MERKLNVLKDPEVLRELIRELIGPIYPSGDSGLDKERLDNLKIYGELVNLMVKDIDDIAWNYKDFQEKSIKDIVKEANNILSNKLGIVE